MSPADSMAMQSNKSAVFLANSGPSFRYAAEPRMAGRHTSSYVSSTFQGKPGVGAANPGPSAC